MVARIACGRGIYIDRMSEDKKTVLVSGATGVIGDALCRALESKGHTARRLSRGADTDVRWDLDAGTIDAGALSGVDVVVHLAGERVAQRWTVAAKARIIDSRIEGAKLLVRAMLEQENPPDYISASGVHFYGYQCGTGVAEASPSGDGFLAEVCRRWEGAAQPLIDAGIRTVFARFGLVLSARGGALPRLLAPFKFGVGGRIGSGEQHMSWVSLPDVVGSLLLAIEDRSIAGPLNVVSPMVVRNVEFVETLGDVLNRPTVFPLPEIVVKSFFGAMGLEALCADINAVPQRLIALGYQWEYADLRACLAACVDERF